MRAVGESGEPLGGRAAPLYGVGRGAVRHMAFGAAARSIAGVQLLGQSAQRARRGGWAAAQIDPGADELVAVDAGVVQQGEILGIPV